MDHGALIKNVSLRIPLNYSIHLLKDLRTLVYSMAQASKGVLPRDVGGPWGKRIGVSVQGSMSWGLIVGAYETGRVNPSDWNRYSLVVLNWCDPGPP